MDNGVSWFGDGGRIVPNGGTYADYLRIVRSQEERDRDTFTRTEPEYDLNMPQSLRPRSFRQVMDSDVT